MTSTELNFTEQEKEVLMSLAREGIRYAVEHGQVMPVNVKDYPEKLQQERACFVTFHVHGNLRGCIGSIIATRPLVQDVVSNAHAAGFRDSRFPPLSAKELEHLDIHISVLSDLETLEFNSEAELLSLMRPGVDGLILQDGPHQGSFLPVMWERLPTPEEFLFNLKIKAGLAPTHWSDNVKVFRYTAESIP